MTKVSPKNGESREAARWRAIHSKKAKSKMVKSVTRWMIPSLYSLNLLVGEQLSYLFLQREVGKSDPLKKIEIVGRTGRVGC